MFNLIPWKRRQDVPVRRQGELPVEQFRREWDQLLDRFFGDFEQSLGPWGNGFRMGSLMDLEDQEKEYVLRAELPGFEPDEIDVKVSGNVMTIRAEHKEEEKGKNGSSYRHGQFHETLTLPKGVLSGKIDARYHSGVLEVHLPKSEDSQAKRIAVKSA